MNQFAGYREQPDGTPGAHRWWDAAAEEYLAEHGAMLGEDAFVWGPEGLTEDEAGLLGDVAGRDVLEVGAGAAQCARWCAARGARVVASDISAGMLAQGALLNERSPSPAPLVQADARALPFADASFDVAFTAYGALPFVAETGLVHREVARVLRPGGRWVFSVTHPIRWAFPDDPTERGLTAVRSYFDRRPYVEEDESGAIEYAEHHRTLGDHVSDVVGAGLVIDRLLEPEWPAERTQAWDGWSPTRGALLPGTLVVVAHRP